jgi:enediyne biosynthesis protein E4
MRTSPLSPRRRRRRWTLALLAATLASGTAIGLLVHQRSRPAAYRPDERPSDITSALSKSLPPQAPKPNFTDVTQPAGLHAFLNFAGNRTSQLPEDMGPGLAWGDFDNDGDDDLFLVSAGGALDLGETQLLPCALFENLANGSFRRVEGFPELRLRGMGAAWGDYNGDGYLDLVVVGYNTLLLLRNNQGSGRFTPDPALPNLPGFWSSPTWTDFNNDRRLDLYVCQYVQYAENEADRDLFSDQVGTPVPFTLNPASYPPGLNALFRQNPDGSFTDVAAELGVHNPDGRSLGGLWHDFDQDGWLDLYVANDVSDNVLYHNRDGTFTDISHPAWVADYRGAMGLAAADFDRDNDDDLFVTHWVAQENGLYENLWSDLNQRQAASPQDPTAPAPAPTPTSPQSTPAPRFQLRFVDIADRVGLGQIALPCVGWGADFADLDHDGWLDLAVANGSTLEIPGSTPKQLRPQPLFLFWNQTGRAFHNLAPLHPGLSQPRVSRGLAFADFDLDGDLDLAVADLYEGVRLFRNDMAQGNWLKIRLRSRNAEGTPNGFGLGSTAIAWIGELPLRRSVNSISYLSQSSHTLHWGLGSATRLDRFEVRWHAGITQVFHDLAPNTFYELLEGDPIPRTLGAPSPTPSTLASSAHPSSPPPSPDDKQRLLEFWKIQRAAMNAMMVERNNATAIPLFRQAIHLNPQHQDSRYYLGLCLASQREIQPALDALAALQELNPRSHRAWQQWGVIRALFATSDADLAAAEHALLQARTINPEETGALLMLGEVALLRGQFEKAEEHFAAATFTNPRATGGFFLQAYLAWRRHHPEAARLILEQARHTLGPEWQPEGATSEGDVKHRQHVEHSPLAQFWESWDGQPNPETAFAKLHQHLSQNTRDE